MAQRKSTKQTAARERARELAAAHLEREQRLVTLAGDYLVAAGDVHEVDEWEEQQIAKVREQAQIKRAEAEQGTRTAVAAVLAEGISKADAAKRLAVPVKELTRLSADAESARVRDDSQESQHQADAADESAGEPAEQR